VKKKTSNVPVYLIYAGIIHLIGLALLMPMLITLPGPGAEVAPPPAAVDVEIISGAPPQAKIDADNEPTAALPPAPTSEETADKPGTQGEIANVSPESESQDDAAAPEQAAPSAAKSEKKTAPIAGAPRTNRKPVVRQGRAAKPVVRRAAKSQAKITPFNGALSGLFSPGAPANTRRR
jgi:hypothetical protein